MEGTQMAGSRKSDEVRILFREGIEFTGIPLPEILQGRSYELITCDRQGSLGKIISNLDHRPDLLIASLGSTDPSMLEEIRELRAPARNRQIPILGVTIFANSGMDIPMLRAHGIVGLIDENSEPQAVLRRIDFMVGSLERCRRQERTPCFFPVEILTDGYFENEYALNLSAGGIRMTVDKPVDPNTDLKLRFRLPMISDNLIAVTGRVVHRLPKQNSAGRYEIGAFFYPMSPLSHDLIANEVERLLAD